MPRRLLTIISATALLLCASATFAWNAAGHMAIASIAYDELSDHQRRALVSLLKEHPRFQQDFQAQLPAGLVGDALDRWIFMHAATWPDIARGLTGEDQKVYNRPMWHFIDLPVYLDDTARQKIHPPSMEMDWHKASSAMSMNVVQALNKAMADLNDPQVSSANKAVALCWVLHLAGDIHQPLHGATLYSAARFRGVPFGDRGGNSIPVRETVGITAKCKSPQLHCLWDSMLGDDDSYSAAVTLEEQLKKEHSKGELAEALKQMDPAAWAQESNELAKQSVYTSEVLTVVAAGEAHPHAPLPAVEITDQYIATAKAVASKRAALAGYRTAELLRQVMLPLGPR